MKRLFVVATMGLSVIALRTEAEAKGCIKGVILGGIAGHYAGHRVLGALGGCAVGRHLANEQAARQVQQPVPEQRR